MELHQLGNINIKKDAIVTTGIFDGVHLGHQSIFEEVLSLSKERALDSVLVTYWPHPRKYFTHSPVDLITTLEEKISLVESIGFDHMVILPFDEHLAKMDYQTFTKDIIVNKLKAKLWLLGFNHRFGNNREGGYQQIKDEAQNYDLEVKQLQPILLEDLPMSSSLIRSLIVDGKLSKVKDVLGRLYTMSGSVVEGEQIGRTIGFPTANIEFDAEKILPAQGAYHVYVHYKSNKLSGMMNIGIRPTVSSKIGKPVSEVHIFNFNESIYGQRLTIEFIDMIRPEMKFSSLEMLKAQLEKDRAFCLKNAETGS